MLNNKAQYLIVTVVEIEATYTKVRVLFQNEWGHWDGELWVDTLENLKSLRLTRIIAWVYFSLVRRERSHYLETIQMPHLR